MDELTHSGCSCRHELLLLGVVRSDVFRTVFSGFPVWFGDLEDRASTENALFRNV